MTEEVGTSAIAGGVSTGVGTVNVSARKVGSLALIGNIAEQVAGYSSSGAFITNLVISKNTVSAEGGSNNSALHDIVITSGTGTITGSATTYSSEGGTNNVKLEIERGCPLSLDMDGDGIETLNIDNTDIYFNTKNNEFLSKTGWLDGDDALLAIDTNGNGKIDSQSELFGSDYESGFSVLKNYDTNNDNIIDANDTQFNDLRIWQDANENAITDAGELKTLTEAGITSISVNSQTMNQEQNQNTITGVSSFNFADETQGNICQSQRTRPNQGVYHEQICLCYY